MINCGGECFLNMLEYSFLYCDNFGMLDVNSSRILFNDDGGDIFWVKIKRKIIGYRVGKGSRFIK